MNCEVHMRSLRFEWGCIRYKLSDFLIKLSLCLRRSPLDIHFSIQTIWNGKMTLLQRFKEFIQQQNLFHQKDKLLLAVSGGVDSVVLCELCKQAGYNFTIAHCNFKLRDNESERDKEFVKTLGDRYNVEVLVKELILKNMRRKIKKASRKQRGT